MLWNIASRMALRPIEPAECPANDARQIRRNALQNGYFRCSSVLPSAPHPHLSRRRRLVTPRGVILDFATLQNERWTEIVAPRPGWTKSHFADRHYLGKQAESIACPSARRRVGPARLCVIALTDEPLHLRVVPGAAVSRLQPTPCLPPALSWWKQPNQDYTSRLQPAWGPALAIRRK
jgi:hypothetical protein